MYSFAPASNALHTNSTAEVSGIPMQERKRSGLARLANQAAQASHQMLSIVINVLEPSGLMRYLPVRCWLYIVAAHIHLLKVCLIACEGSGLNFAKRDP
jgi:hypothetical protein